MVKIKTADILTIKIDEKILPFIVQDLANIIGLADTLKLVDHYKGTSMWVPAEFKPDHILCKIIGAESFIKLTKSYGGEALEIPKCEDALRAVRNEKIRLSDKSQSQLAREWDVTVRWIRELQKNMDCDEVQENLF